MKMHFLKSPLLLMFLLLIFSCEKEQVTEEPTPSLPTNKELLSEDNWFYTKLTEDGQEQPITKELEVKFAANGNYYRERDASNQWVTKGNWEFSDSDQEEIVLFKGTPDEVIYSIKILTGLMLRVQYTQNGKEYMLTMEHEAPELPDENRKFNLLTAHSWLNKVIYLNGSLITNDGKDPHLFEPDGTYREGRDTNGDWKRVDTWEFANADSTAVKIFVGKANEQFWSITKLTESTLNIEYVSANGTFNFEMIPE